MFMNFMINLFLIGAASDEPAGRETGLSGCSHDIMDAKMTSALAPAFSPRRGRIVRRFFENLYDWIGGTLIRKTRNQRKQFPLLGERIKGEGGRKHSFHWKRRGNRRFILAGAIAAAALMAVLLAPVEQKTFGADEHLAQVETPKAAAKQLVREPAVAGLFYPKDPAELSRMIDRLLAAAPVGPLGDLKAIVCPHAGYEFSGPVAAYAFKNLIGRHFDTVIILGCLSHAARAGANLSQSPGTGKNQSLPQRAFLSGATSRLVAAVIQAGARPGQGHAGYLGTFRRSRGAIFTKGFDELFHFAGGVRQCGPGAGGAGGGDTTRRQNPARGEFGFEPLPSL
jgi:hypothetical protein